MEPSRVLFAVGQVRTAPSALAFAVLRDSAEGIYEFWAPVIATAEQE